MTLGDSGAPLDMESLLRAGDEAEGRGDFVSAAACYRSLADSADPAVSAEGHFRLGVLAWRQSRLDVALDEFARTRELARAGRRPELEARAHNGEGNVHCLRGEYAQAEASYRVAMEVTTDANVRGRSLQNLGVLANIQGDLEGALQHYGRARNAFRDLGDLVSEAPVLHNMGMLHADRDEWDEADDCYRQALALYEAIANKPMIATVLANWSEVLAARGATADAVRHCRLAITIYAETGDEVGRGEAERWLGHALRLEGDLVAAERALTSAVRVATRHGIKLLEAEVSRELQLVQRARGATRQAELWRMRALALFRQLGAAREIAELEGEGT